MNIFELQEALRKTTKILAGKNIDVIMEGFQPRVEYDPATKMPVRVFIPAITEDTDSALIEAIHGFIDHECSHIAFSNADDICDGTQNQLWHYVHNCIEDPRVNKAMGERYPGSQKNIRRGYEWLFKNAGQSDPTKPQPNPYDRESVEKFWDSKPDDAAIAQWQLNYASLWFAGKMGCNLSRNKFNELNLDQYYKDLVAKADKNWLDRLATINDASDVRACSDYWTGFFSEEALKKMKPPPSGGGKKGELTEKDIEDLMKDTKSLEDQLAEEIKMKIKYENIQAKQRFWWTDRWDTYYDKKKIVSGLNSRGRTQNVTQFEEKTKRVTNYLAKDLRRLLEEKRRRFYVGGHKSGKLNARALYSVRFGNDRIFKKKSPIREINGAVSLLIDMSGSMCGDKVYTAMQSAYAFAMVLTTLKVPFEIFGFVTEDTNHEMYANYERFVKENGPEIEDRIINDQCPERIYAFKTFEEKFDIVSKTGMTGAAHSGLKMIQNEDSKHVMLALSRLSARPEPVKSLFIFSDGMPAYYSRRPKHSADQLKFYGKNAKKKYGVDIYSIGIQSDSVKNFYPQYKVVHNIDELPTALFDFLRKIF